MCELSLIAICLLCACSVLSYPRSFITINKYRVDRAIDRYASTVSHNVSISLNYVNQFVKQLNYLSTDDVSIKDSEKSKYFNLLLEYLPNLTDKQLLHCLYCFGTIRLSKNLIIDSTQLIDRICSIASTSNHIDLHKLVNGLSRMGFRYSTLPQTIRQQYIYLSNDYIHLESKNAREISTYLYSLGQLECDNSSLPVNVTVKLLESFLSLTWTQGLTNALHGTAKLGVRWKDISNDLKGDIDSAIVNNIPNLKTYELCSLLHSLAVMKCDWNDLTRDCITIISEVVVNKSSSMSHREIANVFWSLGQISASISSDKTKAMISSLIDRLTIVLPQMMMFDVESVFVGLGLMQISFDLLPEVSRYQLVTKMSSFVDSMNIFCIYNVLWGLARMNASIIDLGSELSTQLLDKTLSIFHTFLISQFGDVLWSLGSLGFHCSSHMFSSSDRSRLLAVLSRVMPSLPVRSAVYSLWGLGRMGFNWTEMQSRCSSLEGGREAAPLSLTVIQYLKQRVSSMREHEYTVLLYALGELSTPWQSLGNVTEKISHRATRLSSFLTPRSTSNGLHGLAKCGVRWRDFPISTRDAWIIALTGNETQFGVKAMNAFELSQTLHALGKLQVLWLDLPRTLQSLISTSYATEWKRMTPLGRSVSLFGLSIIGCPRQSLPSNGLIDQIVSDLIDDKYDDFLEREVRYKTSIAAIDKLEIILSQDLREKLRRMFPDSSY